MYQSKHKHNINNEHTFFVVQLRSYVLCFGVLLQKIADDKMTHGLSLQDKKCDHCPACLFLSLDIFDFLLFHASLLQLAGGYFIFHFCMPGKLQRYDMRLRSIGCANERLMIKIIIVCKFVQKWVAYYRSQNCLQMAHANFAKTCISTKYRTIHPCSSMCCEDAKYTMWHTQILTLGLQKCDAVKNQFFCSGKLTRYAKHLLQWHRVLLCIALLRDDECAARW